MSSAVSKDPIWLVLEAEVLQILANIERGLTADRYLGLYEYVVLRAFLSNCRVLMSLCSQIYNYCTRTRVDHEGRFVGTPRLQ